MKKKIYVSSTYEDLHKYREAVNKTIRKMGYEDVAMEYYTAEGRPPLKRCQEDVEDCDIYVCIVAWHYGSIPEGQPEDQHLSFTELEYEHAKKFHKKRLIFLQDVHSRWSPYQMDAINNKNQTEDNFQNQPEKHGHTDRIIEFRGKLSQENIAVFFSTPSNLCQSLVIGLASFEHVLRPANINLLPEPQTNIKITGRTDVVENLIRYYKDNKTAVVACIGEAGLGKSQIVREFLTSFNNDDISQNDQPNLKAQWIYCWSFLNNSKDYLEESSTEFFDSILKFYGFENYPYSEEQQAELLVNLIKTEESLLILHGLDPLLEDQPKNEGLRKRIQDKEKELDKILKKNKNLGKSGEKMDEQLQNKQEKVKLQNELKVIKELNTLISSYKNPNNVVVVKDRPMRIFLRKLCDETKEMGNYHKGLVIITARNAISDLNPYLHSTHKCNRK